ncbi:hypothetical protein PWT90_10651 [Aphanocladium album]|nr:hypothetical protein PWT90_10651 [Aphanocladium album]
MTENTKQRSRIKEALHSFQMSLQYPTPSARDRILIPAACISACLTLRHPSNNQHKDGCRENSPANSTTPFPFDRLWIRLATLKSPLAARPGFLSHFAAASSFRCDSNLPHPFSLDYAPAFAQACLVRLPAFAHGASSNTTAFVPGHPVPDRDACLSATRLARHRDSRFLHAQSPPLVFQPFVPVAFASVRPQAPGIPALICASRPKSRRHDHPFSRRKLLSFHHHASPSTAVLGLSRTVLLRSTLRDQG